MRVEGGNVVAFDECESMNNGKEVSLYLKVILRDVDGNDRVTFVGRDDFLKENPVFFAEMEATFGEMMERFGVCVHTPNMRCCCLGTGRCLHQRAWGEAGSRE